MIRDTKISVQGTSSYYWVELTFLIHQLHGRPVTAVCCDVEDKFGPNSFRTALLRELRESNMFDPDRKAVQAILLQCAVMDIDGAVWSCSNAVRTLEKVNFARNFPALVMLTWEI